MGSFAWITGFGILAAAALIGYEYTKNPPPSTSTPPSTTPPSGSVGIKYSCTGGQCVQDPNGAFLSLADCQSSCYAIQAAAAARARILRSAPYRPPLVQAKTPMVKASDTLAMPHRIASKAGFSGAGSAGFSRVY